MRQDGRGPADMQTHAENIKTPYGGAEGLTAAYSKARRSRAGLYCAGAAAVAALAGPCGVFRHGRI